MCLRYNGCHKNDGDDIYANINNHDNHNNNDNRGIHHKINDDIWWRSGHGKQSRPPGGVQDRMRQLQSRGQFHGKFQTPVPVA